MKKAFPDNPYLEVRFEDFFGNYPKVSEKVLDFLRVDRCEVRLPNLKKLNSDSVKEIIENHEEIFAILKGTSCECYLE